MDRKKKNAFARYALFFIVGLAVLVGAETGVLFYMNNVYLHESDNYTVTRLTSSASNVQKHRSLTLDSSAQDIAVSHDGDYLAYLENGQIQIVNMDSGEKTAVPAQTDRTVAYFKWVYDRDRLTIVEKNASSSSDDGTDSGDSSDTDSEDSSLKTSKTAFERSKTSSRSSKSSDYGYYAELYSFDMSDKTVQLVRDYMNNQDVKISLNSAEDSITGMDMSTETVVTYLKITSTSGRSRLWEANITVKNAALADLPTRQIGNIQSLKSNDSLLYEDKDSGHVYLYDAKEENSTVFSVNGQKSLCLLGFDQNDNQYLGVVQNNLVTSVVYGDPTGSTWNTLALSAPVQASAISVAYSGAVYVNDSTHTTVKELVSGKSTSYSGKFLLAYDNGFYALDDGTVRDYPVETKTGGTSSNTSSASSSATSNSASSAASNVSSPSSRKSSS